MKSKKKKKKSALVVGDSMNNGMEETLQTRHIRVQTIPGARIEDVESNLDELLHKDLRTMVIHVGTNNSVIDSLQVIFDKLLSVKKEIQSVSNCNVIISNLIKRTDNHQANSVNEKVNQLLKNSKFHVTNDDNIMEKQLGKRGLHLNTHGNVLLASNVLHAIRNPK